MYTGRKRILGNCGGDKRVDCKVVWALSTGTISLFYFGHSCGQLTKNLE